MAVQRDIWEPSFITWPQLPCPSCKVGVLKIDEDSISKEETASSKAAWAHEAWDPDWIVKRFIAILTCANPSCQDRIFVCGKITTDWFQFYEDDGSSGSDTNEYFVPHYFEPALRVFPVPDECPRKIADELQKAFALIWSDIASAGNRVRVAVEALMNERKIPQRTKIKKGKRKGKFRPLSLHERIERFAAVHEAAATQLMAVKWLGNAGSHAAMSALTHDDLLDAFEHFEYTLDLVYAKTTADLARRAKAIAKRKGSIRTSPGRRRRFRARGRGTR